MSASFRPASAADEEVIVAFAASVSDHDLLFLGRDLRHPRVVAAWMSAIEEGWIESLLAEDETGLVGCAALVRDPLGWSKHVAEIRLLIADRARGQGLGRNLIQPLMASATEGGLAKLTASMTPDQRAAIILFEGLGFRAEALLRDHVRGSDGESHDLAIFAYDIANSGLQHRRYGFDAVAT